MAVARAKATGLDLVVAGRDEAKLANFASEWGVAHRVFARWRGVPFYFRAGKCLPVTCTGIVIRLRQPPTMYEGFDLKMNHCRLESVRTSPLPSA